MLDVCLLGTGGMMPLPYRWLTSLMTRYNGSSLMIDCGEGTQIAVKEKGWSFKPVDIMCFTHYHADHISGLPGILLTMGNAERTLSLIHISHQQERKYKMDITAKIAEELGIRKNQAQAAIQLIDEGNTIPFIARYRKEATGALNDEILRNLFDRLTYLRNLEEKKAQVIASIEEQGKLTDELRDVYKRQV